MLKSSLQDVVDSSDLVILGNKDQSFEQVLAQLPLNKRAIDLVGFMRHTSNENSEGICW